MSHELVTEIAENVYICLGSLNASLNGPLEPRHQENSHIYRQRPGVIEIYMGAGARDKNAIALKREEFD